MDVFRTIKSEKNQSLLFLQIQFTLNVVYTYSVHTLWLLYFDFPLLCLYVVLQRCDHILDGIDILLLWRRELNNSTLVKCTTTTSCCYGESSIVHRFTTTTYVTGSKKRGNFAQNANFFTTFQTVTTPRPSEPLTSRYLYNWIITHVRHLRVFNCARDRVTLLTVTALDVTQDDKKEF